MKEEMTESKETGMKGRKRNQKRKEVDLEREMEE